MDDNRHASLKKERTGADSTLPHLAAHMNALEPDGEPMSLLRAFHGPFPPNLPVAYRTAMDAFFQNVLKYPYFLTFGELALAEAWLKADRIPGRKMRSA